MPFDVYALCPCGSGKKLKFCCHAVVADMEKVNRLRESNQGRAAFHLLEELAAARPGVPWFEVSRATYLMADDRPREAAEVLDRLIADKPDHETALNLHATATFLAEGYAAARPQIYRAFQRCATSGVSREVGAWLASRISSVMEDEGRFLAAREHAALALRLSDESGREEAFMDMLNMDGNANVPYPFRGVHPLVPGPDGEPTEIQQARRLSALGCWEPAARRFTEAAEQTNRPEYWHNAGLCRAWSGDEELAAEALHRAASIYDDFDSAVECETIAQLLDINRSDDWESVQRQFFKVESVGRLLTKLDAAPLFERLELPPQNQPSSLVAALYLLDRPADLPKNAPLTPETCPRIRARFLVFDSADNRAEPVIELAALGNEIPEARRLLEEAAAGEIEPATPETDQPPPERAYPRPFASLWIDWHLTRPSAQLRIDLIYQLWNRFVDETWPQTKQPALGGKSPAEAAADPQLRVPLAAAVYVLDAWAQVANYELDRAALLTRLGLDLPAPIPLSEKQSLQCLSGMQLMRVGVSDASDAQLKSIVNRAAVMGHTEFLYRVLSEAVERPEAFAERRQEYYLRLASLANQQNRHEVAIEWFMKGKELFQAQSPPFDKMLEFELGELQFRLDDPSDPMLPTLIRRFDEYYCRKVPQLKMHLDNVLARFGVREPGEQLVLSGDAAEPAVSSGIWTPSGSSASPGGSQKLWIPGQNEP